MLFDTESNILMSQQNTHKKIIETHYMLEARRASYLFPVGELIPHERPDFLLHSKNGLLGIEITVLCREEARATAGKLAKVPNKALLNYSLLPNAVAVDVSVGFSQQARYIKFNDLKNSLVEFVYQHCPQPDQGYISNLPSGFNSIEILSPVETEGRWWGTLALDTSHATKKLLENRIAKKNQPLADYKLSAPKVWLLIVNDYFLGAGEVYVNPKSVQDWRFYFDFEKVLLFLRQPGGGGQIIEIQKL